MLDPSKRMNLQEMLQHDLLSAAPLPKQLPVSTITFPLAENFAFPYLLHDVVKQSSKQQNPLFSPTPKSAQKATNNGSAMKQIRSLRGGDLNSAQKQQQLMKSPNAHL